MSFPTCQPEAFRAVRRDIAATTDEKIARVVAMLDAMPQRGEADALIASLRPRLAQMSVPRRLSFARLLFLPLDPVLVNAADWERGSPALPRSVLPSLAAVVRAGMGSDAAQPLTEYRAHPREVVAAEGPRLWRGAANILAAAEVPAGWQAATGLPNADFVPISRAAALVLGRASCTLVAEGGAQVDVDALADAALAQPESTEAGPLSTLLAILLSRLCDAEGLLDAFQRRETAANRATLRRARDGAIRFVLGRCQDSGQLPPDLDAARPALERHVTILENLTHWADLRTSPYLDGIATARRGLDLACRDRVGAAVARRIVAPTERESGPADDQAVAKVEQAARDVRRFASVARRLGGEAYYDKLLRDAAMRVTAAPVGRLTVVDRARLMELLVGPEEGLRLLQAQTRAP